MHCEQSILDLPRHIRDLLAGSRDDSLQQALVDFLNLMLSGAFDQEMSSIIFGGRLIALSKKDCGIRSICAGYTLRKLAAYGLSNNNNGDGGC